jgi:carboxyl-terminal processing protease
MKKGISLLSIAVGIILFSTSCRKELNNVQTPENYTGASFSSVFESFWNGMNTNYVFWDIEATDWDAKYRTYKPLFDKLKIDSLPDVQKSVQYFREMTADLKDSHFNISFAPPIADSFVSPAYQRKLNAGILRQQYFFYDYDAHNYLDSGYISGADSVNVSSSSPTEAIAGTIKNGKILYLGFNQFDLKSSYSGTDNGVKKALQFFINYLRNPPADFGGVVIDVRGNGGGNLDDLNLLMGNLISEKLTIGYTRYKSGNGRLDYTPWADAIVTPQPGAKAVTVPVVALTDIYSTSMAELTAMSVQLLPNGHTVGETTWGANGPLTQNIVFNAGQFTAANFLFAYTSSAAFKYIDGNIYEGKGFPPEFMVPFNINDFRQKGDLQLEKALTLMN